MFVDPIQMHRHETYILQNQSEFNQLKSSLNRIWAADIAQRRTIKGKFPNLLCFYSLRRRFTLRQKRHGSVPLSSVHLETRLISEFCDLKGAARSSLLRIETSNSELTALHREDDATKTGVRPELRQQYFPTNNHCFVSRKFKSNSFSAVKNAVKIMMQSGLIRVDRSLRHDSMLEASSCPP